jgi:hypothetical protein
VDSRETPVVKTCPSVPVDPKPTQRVSPAHVEQEYVGNLAGEYQIGEYRQELIYPVLEVKPDEDVHSTSRFMHLISTRI